MIRWMSGDAVEWVEGGGWRCVSESTAAPGQAGFLLWLNQFLPQEMLGILRKIVPLTFAYCIKTYRPISVVPWLSARGTVVVEPSTVLCLEPLRPPHIWSYTLNGRYFGFAYKKPSRFEVIDKALAVPYTRHATRAHRSSRHAPHHRSTF